MRSLAIVLVLLLSAACDGENKAAIEQNDAAPEGNASEAEERILVKVTQIPADAPVKLDELSTSALEGVAADTLAEVKKSLAGSMRDPREAAKLENATSKGSFGTVAGTRLAIVRVRVGETQPIAVIMGPSQSGLTEIYCSNQAGEELSLRNNECAEAIRTSFGGDVVE